jgi:hypothetical protein
MEIHVLLCRPISDATRIILVYDDVILREALLRVWVFGARLWTILVAFTNTQLLFYLFSNTARFSQHAKPTLLSWFALYSVVQPAHAKTSLRLSPVSGYYLACLHLPYLVKGVPHICITG